MENKIPNGIINIIKFALSAILVFLLSYILQINFVISIFLLTLVIYLKFRNLNLKDYNLLSLTLLFVIIFVISYSISKHKWPVFCIPFCVIPMLTTILFNQLELSLLMTLASFIAVASMGDNNFYLGLLFFTSGILSSILVFGGRRRMAVIRAGFIIGLLQAIGLFFISHWNSSPVRYAFLIINGIVSSIIVLGVLPVFEYLFKTVTNISLLELADFNHPLLRNMILKAPGTYHHSLIVGNLAEQACEVIGGVNSLLARIGAYYHDIGKIEKAEYFSENQTHLVSKHDELSASMSKLVIMNHVREGVELARGNRLNPRIIDFILQHHGNSLVYYFYRRALESLEEDQQIKEEGFRYPGPKPNTKETAIVLLADSVEAATRALKDPAPAKIQEVVHKVINNKFIDGQLDECELTLKDLEKISAVFIRILSGIYHNRITYPESPVSEPRSS